MTKKQMVMIGAAICVVPLLIVVLYNSLFVAPQFAETGAEARGLSVMRIGNPVMMNQTLDVAGDTRLKGDLTVTGDIAAASLVTDGNASLVSLETTGNITAAGVLRLGGYSQSGAVRFGETSNVISGTKIAHGFGTTPTVFIPRNYGLQGVGFTQTLYAFGCNTVSCTVGIGEGSVVTFTVDWIAGK